MEKIANVISPSRAVGDNSESRNYCLVLRFDIIALLCFNVWYMLYICKHH